MITYYKDCGSFTEAQAYGGQRSRLGHHVLYAPPGNGTHRVYFSPGPVDTRVAINVKDLEPEKK